MVRRAGHVRAGAAAARLDSDLVERVGPRQSSTGASTSWSVCARAVSTGASAKWGWSSCRAAVKASGLQEVVQRNATVCCCSCRGECGQIAASSTAATAAATAMHGHFPSKQLQHFCASRAARVHCGCNICVQRRVMMLLLLVETTRSVSRHSRVSSGSATRTEGACCCCCLHRVALLEEAAARGEQLRLCRIGF